LWAVFKLAVLAAASAAFITAFSTACVCARFQFPQFQPSAKVPPVPLAAVLAAADDAAPLPLNPPLAHMPAEASMQAVLPLPTSSLSLQQSSRSRPFWDSGQHLPATS
jgi:hypothetical protein